MTTQLRETVDRYCPKDGKKLTPDMGQHEDRGDIEITYECWHCDWRERHNDHIRPRQSVGRSLRRLLDEVRLGNPAVSLTVDDYWPTPPEVWGCGEEFRRHLLRTVGDGQWECLECGDQVYESEVEAVRA